ncbi:phospholipase A-2-activating protein-like [Apostichopus japonicus]|uniref:phospholipase A-2-activating protein-like n=1 Tax=Stichopus japonicus TaxID=307972 RepID=UPI003AB7D63E
MSNFKLSCVLSGHESDVRAVCQVIVPTSPNSVVTASRDQTARVWVPSGDGKSFSDCHCMSGHKSFISSVATLPPNEKYPQGLIVTGGNDAKINAYTLESPMPVYTLTGHSGTVCALAFGKFGTLLSGSWDCSAKVWLDSRCMLTLEGHEAAIWDVALMPSQGLMLTASADKLIKLWKAGKCERTFKGHQDCVRGLAVVSDVEFLSVSNDTTIRRWLITGECMETFHGHTNFIYSISLLADGQGFVSSGEDRTVKVWKEGECKQTITLPAQSVWSVCSLPNGDIVAGASDGVARVFTTDPERIADPDTQAMFERQLSSFAMPAKTQAFGDIKMEDLPDSSDLRKPGSKDGQTKLIRAGNKVEAYSWSVAEDKWTKIGDVVGGEGDDVTPSTSKVMYEGKEYDHVFDVDIEDGARPLKLPFNLTDDPWMEAQKFIHRNDLSQYYLEEVANFIIKNTKGVTLQAATPGFHDPFTGGTRYIPGGQVDQSLPAVGRAAVEPQNVADPFTGGSRYVPGGATQPPPMNHSQQLSNGASRANQYFPQTDFVTFDSIKANAVLGKIQEFNTQVTESEQLSQEEMSTLESFIERVADPSGDPPTAHQLGTLWKLLQWPHDKVFPGLDVLRLAIRHPVVNQHLCNSKDGDQFISHLLKLGSQANPGTNQMLALRTLCNAFSQPDGLSLLEQHRERLVQSVLDFKASSHKGTRIALSTLLLNFAAKLSRSGDVESRAQCMSSAALLLQDEKEVEAVFRLMVAIGTLSSDDNALAIVRSLDLKPILKGYESITDPAKVGECAVCLQKIL